ncbi:MAG: hypothetical protein ACREA0_03210 [bacterium]
MTITLVTRASAVKHRAPPPLAVHPTGTTVLIGAQVDAFALSVRAAADSQGWFCLAHGGRNERRLPANPGPPLTPLSEYGFEQRIIG